jgi:hypothetical protein
MLGIWVVHEFLASQKRHNTIKSAEEQLRVNRPEKCFWQTSYQIMPRIYGTLNLMVTSVKWCEWFAYDFHSTSSYQFNDSYNQFTNTNDTFLYY